MKRKKKAKNKAATYFNLIVATILLITGIILFFMESSPHFAIFCIGFAGGLFAAEFWGSSWENEN